MQRGLPTLSNAVIESGMLLHIGFPTRKAIANDCPHTTKITVD